MNVKLNNILSERQVVSMRDKKNSSNDDGLVVPVEGKRRCWRCKKMCYMEKKTFGDHVEYYCTGCNTVVFVERIDDDTGECYADNGDYYTKYLVQKGEENGI